MNLDPKKFVFTLRRDYPPFYLSLFFRGYPDKKNWEKFLGVPYEGIKEFVIADNRYYYPRSHMIDFAREIAERMFSDKSLFLHIKKQTLRLEQQLILSVDKGFEPFCSAYANYMPALALYFICDPWIEKKVRDLLCKNTSEKEVCALMQYLTIPLLDNFIVQEKLDLLKMKSPKKHLAEYGWMKSRYGFLENYSEEEVQEFRERLQSEHFLVHYSQQKEKIQKAILRAKKLLDKKDRHVIDLMQFFIYYRTQRTDVMNKVSYYFAPELKKVAQHLGIEYEDILYCTSDEIRERKVKKDILKERRKKFAFLVQGGIITVLAGKDTEEVESLFSESMENNAYVKGQVAYAGKVKGLARIVLSKKDIGKVKKGDILVTSMTIPDMITGMEKAAAFVTDEGGITCHAAIVAREMKKPCVIGTKVATKVFKDGDMVEVDATHGRAKIVKKHNP